MTRGFRGAWMRWAAAGVMGFTAAACASISHGGGSTPDFYGTTWRLAAIGQQPAIPSDVSRRPWLRFSADSNRVVGSGGCNRLSGPFTRNGASLRFGAIAATKMACADEAMNRQEQAFLNALQSTDVHEVEDNSLVLRKGNEVVARLVR